MPIISLQNAKLILEIEGSDKDYKIKRLITDIQKFITSKCRNYFEVGALYNPNRPAPISAVYDPYAVTLFDSSLSFVKSGPKIVDSNSNFLNAGFSAGMDVRVQYSIKNNGIFEISTVTANELTLQSDSVIFDESISNYIRLAWVQFPEDLELVAIELLKIGYNKDLSEEVKSERVGNTNFTYITEEEKMNQIIKMMKHYMRPGFV